MKLPLLILATVIGFGAVVGDAHAQATSGRQYFGNYKCSQKVPCKYDSGFDSKDYANAGTTCMQEVYNFKPTDDTLFDEYAGLNSNDCLTRTPSKNPSSKELNYECCVVHLKEGDDKSICVMQCAKFVGN